MSVKGINFDYENKQSFNKLITAVHNRDEKQVKKLLKLNWSPNSTDNQGRTAVHLAARSASSHNILKLLLDNGGLPDNVNHSGATALCLAAYAGAHENVALLLDNGASVNVKNSIGASPLHYACNGCSVEAVQLLVQAGCNINGTDFYEVTPLMLAVTNKKLDIVRYLLDNGADLLLKDSEEKTVFHEPCLNDNIALLDLLLKSHPKPKEVGNIMDSEGWTTLMIAAQSGSVKITEKFIQFGSDTSKTNSSGLMALHLAAHNSLECFKLLLAATPVKVINANCVFKSKAYNNSLPCLLLDKYFLDGLKLLLDKPGIKKGVLLCPLFRDSRLCGPVQFTLHLGADYNFTSSVIQLYIDKALCLDPEFSIVGFPDVNIDNCLESLIATHNLFHLHLPINADNNCQCPKLFITLLENGANPDPHRGELNFPLNTVLWFFYNHGSIFGLSYLLRYSNFLEPHNILKLFTNYFLKMPTDSMNKQTFQTIEFLCMYCRPWDVARFKKLIKSKVSSIEFRDRLLSYYQCNDGNFPSLKFLCRSVVRDHIHSSLGMPSEFHSRKYNPAKLFRQKLTSLPIPKSLLSYLQYDDIIFSLKNKPNYPSFDMPFQLPMA